MKSRILIFLILVATVSAEAQTTNDLLNLLMHNNYVTQEQADSLRADAAIKQQEADAKKKSFPVTSEKTFKLSGYGHFRYQYLQEEGKNDGIDIRRAYVDIRGNITPYWSYRMQSDFAGIPKIMDIYAELKINGYLNFTIGQQVIPFSLNNYTSNTKLELADRVQVVESFSSRKGDVLGDNNGRDIGISVYGSFLSVNETDLVEYRLGVYNGSGLNKADLNEAKDIIGRVLLHPLNGFVLGCSFYTGRTPDSAALNNKTVPGLLGSRQRFAAELNYTYKFLDLKTEYLTAKDGDVNKKGYYIQLAAFVIPSKVQIAGCYDIYDKDTDKDENLNTNITVGANYFINPNALLQVAYKIRQEEGPSIDNNAGSIQLQISF